MDNYSQKTPSFNKGQALPAGALNHVVAAMKRMLVAGAGIRLRNAGDQIVIEAKGQPMARGGGGGGGWIERASRAELPDASTVPITTLARITAGAESGFTLMVSPTGDDWIAWNFWD